MFKKHQGSELNQHIRVIQRLVPGRQRFIHNPIHPSRSISPLVGPRSTERFGMSASCSQFFWLVLILDCTLARVYCHIWVQFICHPSLLCSFSFFPFSFPRIYQLSTHNSSISSSIATYSRLEHDPQLLGLYLQSERVVQWSTFPSGTSLRGQS